MNVLQKDWIFGRIFRLVAGLVAGIYALTSKEYVFLLPKQIYKDIIKPYKPEKK